MRRWADTHDTHHGRQGDTLDYTKMDDTMKDTYHSRQPVSDHDHSAADAAAVATAITAVTAVTATVAAAAASFGGAAGAHDIVQGGLHDGLLVQQCDGGTVRWETTEAAGN